MTDRPSTLPERVARIVAVVAVVLESVSLAATAAAQTTIDLGTTVRLELRDQSLIRGRLLAADSLRLIVGVDSGRMTVDRVRVTKLERRSTNATRVASGFAIGAGLFFGVAGWFHGGGDCATNNEVAGNARNTCGASGHALAIPAFDAGAILGAVSGAIVGTFIPTWQAVNADSSIVKSPRFGSLGAAPCTGRPIVAGSIASMPREGGHSARVSLSFHCEPTTVTGIEAGVFWPGYGAHTWFRGNDNSVVYSGVFIDRRLGRLPFDPRLVTGLGWYRGNPRIPGGWNTTEFGASLGLSSGIQVNQSLSFRTEWREHWVRGSMRTMVASLQYRR